MKVRLTRPFFDGGQYHVEGTVLDLAVPPKSAVVLEEVPTAEEPVKKEK